MSKKKGEGGLDVSEWMHMSERAVKQSKWSDRGKLNNLTMGDTLVFIQGKFDIPPHSLTHCNTDNVVPIFSDQYSFLSFTGIQTISCCLCFHLRVRLLPRALLQLLMISHGCV